TRSERPCLSRSKATSLYLLRCLGCSENPTVVPPDQFCLGMRALCSSPERQSRNASVVLKAPARGIFRKLLPGNHHTGPEYIGSAGSKVFRLRRKTVLFAGGFYQTQSQRRVRRAQFRCVAVQDDD